MARRPELETFAREHGLKIGSIEDLIRYRLATEHTDRARRRARDRHRARRVPPAHLPRPPEPCAAFRAGARRRRRRACRRWCACMCRTRWPTRCIGGAPTSARRSATCWRRSRAKAAARWCCWASRTTPTRCWRASASSRRRAAAARGALAEWRRNGAGAQILADLGLGKLRVLGTPRKQVGLAGFGLEIVEYVEWPRALNCRPPSARRRPLTRHSASRHAPLRRRPARHARRPLRHPRQPLEPAHHRCAGRRRAQDLRRPRRVRRRRRRRARAGRVGTAARRRPLRAPPARTPRSWRWVASSVATRGITNRSPTAAPTA